MEITTIQMYWLVMLDNIRNCLLATLMICGFLGGLGMLAIDEIIMMINREKLILIVKKILVLLVSFILLLIFMPTTKQMAAMLVVPRIANSEKVHTIGNKVYDLAVEWMEELKPYRKESETK